MGNSSSPMGVRFQVMRVPAVVATLCGIAFMFGPAQNVQAQIVAVAAQQEHRVAAANALANSFVREARQGDYFVVTLKHGNTETWEYTCGGAFCAGTVLDASPVANQCW